MEIWKISSGRYTKPLDEPMVQTYNQSLQSAQYGYLYYAYIEARRLLGSE
jgi:hypothetical protein